MKNGGLVVNISSTAGVTCIGDMMATPTYVASKHAVTALTRTFGVSNLIKNYLCFTEWKFHDFSITQILCEINFGDCKN